MYGRKAKLPMDLRPTAEVICRDPEAADLTAQNVLIDIRKDMKAYVSENIVDAQERQKRNYDRRHQSNKTIETGSTVFIKKQQAHSENGF